MNQGVIRREGHITCLNKFNNLVLLTFIFQIEVFLIEIKGSIGVVVDFHVDLVAHLTCNIQVHLLVKIEGRRLTVADRKRGVLDILQRGTQLQFGRSLCFYANATWTEDFLGRTEVEMHITKIELLLTFSTGGLGILGTEELLTGATFAPAHIFGRSHHDGGVQITVAQLRTNIIKIKRVIILHLLPHIIGHTQVERTGIQVGRNHRGRLLNLPAWM